MESNLPIGNYIISANHHSWLDPILLTLAWPDDISMMYIGPRDAVINTQWKRWFIGRMPEVVLAPQRIGWLGKEAHRKVFRELNAGRCLLIFPEGDIFPNEGMVMPYMDGVAYFALKSGLPVVPVGICGTTDLYYRKQVGMHVGKPIQVEYSIRPDKKQVAELLLIIRESTQRLIEGYRDPEVASKPMHWLTHLL